VIDQDEVAKNSILDCLTKAYLLMRKNNKTYFGEVKTLHDLMGNICIAYRNRKENKDEGES